MFDKNKVVNNTLLYTYILFTIIYCSVYNSVNIN